MVSKEKLVDGDLEYILETLYQTTYGEHNIVIYPDLDSFREIYTHLTKARLQDNNDLVLLLPHYETEKSVRHALGELDINVQEVMTNGTLELLDSQHAFFDPTQSFRDTIQGSVNKVIRNGLTGVTIIADMGSYYHRQLLERLLTQECDIPANAPGSMSSIFCCYHGKDFAKLTKQQEEKLCENHYRNLFLRES